MVLCLVYWPVVVRLKSVNTQPCRTNNLTLWWIVITDKSSNLTKFGSQCLYDLHLNISYHPKILLVPFFSQRVNWIMCSFGITTRMRLLLDRMTLILCPNLAETVINWFGCIRYLNTTPIRSYQNGMTLSNEFLLKLLLIVRQILQFYQLSVLIKMGNSLTFTVLKVYSLFKWIQLS